MDDPVQTARALFDAIARGDMDGVVSLTTPDAVLDRSRSRGPWRGVARGHGEILEGLAQAREAFAEMRWELDPARPLGLGLAAVGTRVVAKGAASGAAVIGRGGWLFKTRSGRVDEAVVFQGFDEALAAGRRCALDRARLYFVCEGRPGDGDPTSLLDAALRGGVDVVQLREKAPRCAEEMTALAAPFRRAAHERGAIFFVNDDPELVEPCGADGVHVGQDDTPVAAAREQCPPGSLVGLSTHSPEQFDAACAAEGAARPDQLSAGPVWETPTKAGRPATGLGLVEHAAAAGPDVPPWFAIGGIDLGNVGELVAAGARRAVVVRAIRDAADPEDAARALRAALEAPVEVG